MPNWVYVEQSGGLWRIMGIAQLLIQLLINYMIVFTKELIVIFIIKQALE